MTRERVGSGLAGLGALGCLATAWLHGTGYASISELAADGPEGLQPLMQALWVSFSFHMIIMGLVIAYVAWRRPAGGGIILTLAALSPISMAGLQIAYLGFIPPTAILLTLGAITLLAAGLLAGRR